MVQLTSDSGAPHLTLGVLFVGVAVSSPLYGFTLLQAVAYFRRYPRDKWILKVTVVAVILLETLSSWLYWVTLYHYGIQNKGNPVALTKLIWKLIVPIGVNAVTASIIHCFFAYRLWIMSEKNVYVVFTAILMSMFQLVFNLDVMTLLLRSPNTADITQPVNVINILTFGITAATDVFIAGTLCYFLHFLKNGDARARSLVNRLMITTINNGVLSSAIAMGALASALLLPRSMLPFAFCSVLQKAYANTLMTNLNSRNAGLQSGLNGPTILFSNPSGHRPPVPTTRPM